MRRLLRTTLGRGRRPGQPDERAAVLAAATRTPGPLVVQWGIRTGSPWAPEVIARTATAGELGRDELIDLLATPGAVASRGLNLDPEVLMRWVRIGLGQREVPDDLGVVLDYLGRRLETLRVGRSQFLVLARAYALLGRFDEVRRSLARVADPAPVDQLLAAEAANPWLHDGDPDAWLADVNAAFADTGLAPIVLAPEGRTPFDRLSAPAPDVEAPFLITVLMSCFQPDTTVVSAVRSILAQTWRNLELIVLDDASGPDYAGVLDEIAALDPERVRVVRATENAGTYVRRNDGLDLARGDLVTVHDSDDWAHPQRLETEARWLLDNPERPAVWALSLRATEELGFVTGRNRIPALTPAEPCLMFRRELVLDRIGHYDPVRRAADREYRERIEAAFGVEVPALADAGPVILSRVLPGSLSSPDFVGRWVHPGRIAYRSAFGWWHRRIARAEADPRLPHPLVERPYPAPARIAGGPPDEADVDVLVLLDCREEANPEGFLDDVADELAGLAAGESVALAHVQSFGHPGQGIVADRLQQLVQDGVVTRVLLQDDRCRARRVVVRTLSVLQGFPPEPAPVETGSVVLVEDPRRDHRGEDVALADVTETARGMFGVEPEHRPLGRRDDASAAYAAAARP